MKIRSALVPVIAAVAAYPVNASAESFQKFYQGYLVNMVKAFKTGNISFFDNISTPDFKESGAMGTHDKASAMAEMKQEFSSMKMTSCKVKPISLKPAGSKATAVLWMHADMVMKTPDGKSHKVSMESTETENWVKSGSTWKVKSLVEAKESKMTMDGKPVDPSKMGG